MLAKAQRLSIRQYKRAQLVTGFMKLYAVLGPSQRAIAGENTSRITVSG